MSEGKLSEGIKHILDSTDVALDIRDTKDPTGEIKTFKVSLGTDPNLLARFQYILTEAIEDMPKESDYTPEKSGVYHEYNYGVAWRNWALKWFGEQK